MRSKIIIFLSVFSLLGVFGIQDLHALDKVWMHYARKVLKGYSSDA